MPNFDEIQKNIEKLANKDWNVKAIEARINNLVTNGIPKKRLDPEYIISNKDEIINRVQTNAEEYSYVLKNCSQGSALAIMEEFSLGNMEVIKSLLPFPGIGGTGEMCGGVTGSIIAIGLYFGSDDRLDYEVLNSTISKSSEFISIFKEEIGFLHCSDLIKNLILGKNIIPGEATEEYTKDKGYEKCSILPGVGARIVTELIIDSIEKDQSNE